MVRVKFCGFTNLEDAIAAIELGADLLGFNFYRASPRGISPADCRTIVQGLGGALARVGRPVRLVGVFVNHPPQEVRAILEHCGLHLAQLSGDEPAEDLQHIGPAAFKAVRLARGASLEQAIANLPPRQGEPAFLIDAAVPGHYGGTGHMTDWRQARLAARYFPLLLAGGLTPENAADAAATVQPWGLDVASGIENAPGKKDSRKMAAFVAAVKTTADGSSRRKVEDR